MNESQSASPGRQSIGIICDAMLNKEVFQTTVFKVAAQPRKAILKRPRRFQIYFYPKPKSSNALLEFFTARRKEDQALQVTITDPESLPIVIAVTGRLRK
jgi:hypothetical protein